MELQYEAPEPLRAYAQARKLNQFVDSSGSRWSYRDNGRDARPLVFLPGALGNCDAAWYLAEAFEATHRVLAITYPGGLSPDALAQGLSELLARLETGPVALWGSSYGAWWSQAFVAAFPAQVSALWLGNTFVEGQDVSSLSLFDPSWLETATSREVIEKWDKALQARPNDLLRGVQLHMLHHGLPAQAFHERLCQVANGVGPPAYQKIENTVVCDCEDDPTISLVVRQRVRDRYPQARHITLDQGGHYPHIVAPDALIKAMRFWLA